MQQWYDLSDPAMEDALIDVPTMRRFAGINLISDRIADEITILSFHHLLENHDLGKRIYCFAEDYVYETVKAHLKANGMAMKQSAIIDATLIAAPSSTFMRAKPDYAGGTRTRRVTSDITAARKASPKREKCTSAWTRTTASSIRSKRRLSTCITSLQQQNSFTAMKRWSTPTPATKGSRSEKR
jgi:IS5 family transposase